MAYPFGGPIPFASLIHRLTTQHGCIVRVSRVTYRSPDGVSTTFRYLYRPTADGPRVAALPDQEPRTDAMPTVVRSICTQLGVNHTIFGVLSDDHDD